MPEASVGARRVRRKILPRRISCGEADHESPAIIAPASPSAEARVVTLRGGARWLVTVVARLVSEDLEAGTESARLVLRFECLSQPHRAVRVATVRARTLHSVDDETLGSLATTSAGRPRYTTLREARRKA